MQPRAQWGIVSGGVLLVCTIFSAVAANAVQPGTKAVPTAREVVIPASPMSAPRLQPVDVQGAPRSNDMTAAKGPMLVLMSPSELRPEDEAPSTAATVRNARLLTEEDIAGKELEYLAVPDSDVFVLQMAAIVTQSSAQPVATQPPTATSGRAREAGVAATAMAAKATTMAAAAMATAKEATTTTAAPVRPPSQQVQQMQPKLQSSLHQQRMQTQPTAVPEVPTPPATKEPLVVQQKPSTAPPRQQTLRTLPPAVPKAQASLKTEQQQQQQPDKRSNSKRSPLLDQLRQEAVADDDGGDVIALLPRGFQLPVPAHDEEEEEEGARGGNDLTAELGPQIHSQALPADNYGHSGQDGEEEYQFSYSVHDEERGTEFGQSEQRSAGRTTGRYWQRLPDGRHQAVSYWADGVSGYRAHVQYSDQPAGEHQ